MSWREELILGKAYIEELYIGTYPGSLLSGDELGYIDGVVPGTVAAEKAVVVNDSNDVSGFGALDADTLIASGGTLRVGEATVQQGRVDVYGSPSGDSDGGEIYIHTPEDETTVNHYILRVRNDTDFQLVKGDVGAVMEYRHTFGDMDFMTDVLVSGGDMSLGVSGVQQGRLGIWGSASGDSEGGRIRIYSSTDETTSQYLQLMWEDDTFVIRTEDDDFIKLEPGVEITLDDVLVTMTQGALDLGAAAGAGGVLNLYGEATGSSTGAQLNLFTSDDEVTAQFYRFEINNDDRMVIGTANAGTMMIFDDSDDKVTVSAVLNASAGFEISGAAVDATAAELNLNDNQFANVVFTPSSGSGSGTVDCDFKDAAGVQMATPAAFKFWFASSASGLDFLPITTSVVATAGSVDAQGAVAGADVFHGITDAAGNFAVTVTASSNSYYMVVQKPNGAMVVAAELGIS